MRLWVNGTRPPYMESDENTALTPEQLRDAVNKMTYDGLQLCTIGYFLAMQRIGCTPHGIAEMLETEIPDSREVKAKHIREMLIKYGGDERLRKFYVNAYNHVMGYDGNSAA